MKKKLFATLALVACSESVPPAVSTPEPVAPVVVEVAPPIEAKAHFAVGEKVRLDEQADATIVEVGEIESWTRISTGEQVMARAYMVAVEEQDGTVSIYRVPELILAKKQ